MARRVLRRWERRPPARVKRRRVERAVIGVGMGVVAAVLERRIVKSLKTKGLTERELQQEGLPTATAEPPG